MSVYPDADGLAQAAVQQITERLRRTLDQQELATMIFATGRSQLGLLHHLRHDTQVDWSRVVGFHLDEFLGLSRDHPASFGYYLHHHIAQWLPFKVFNYINGDALEPIAECDRYSQLLTQKPIDLCLLGVGENGHLAFNDPMVAHFNDPRWVKLVCLDDKNRQQQLSSEQFSQLRDVPNYAITLSLKAIFKSRYILCCVLGQHKAKILKTLLTESPSEACPASFLRVQGDSENRLLVEGSAYQFDSP